MNKFLVSTKLNAGGILKQEEGGFVWLNKQADKRQVLVRKWPLALGDFILAYALKA